MAQRLSRAIMNDIATAARNRATRTRMRPDTSMFTNGIATTNFSST